MTVDNRRMQLDSTPQGLAKRFRIDRVRLWSHLLPESTSKEQAAFLFCKTVMSDDRSKPASPDAYRRPASSSGQASELSLEHVLQHLLDADRIARLSARVSDIVAKLYANEGDNVEKGEKLALINSRELAGMKAEFLKAESAEALAEASLDRQEKL